MPESLIVNCIVKPRRMMGVLTSLALSVSITGKSSLSSSSISLLCSAVSQSVEGKTAYILYSALKPAGSSQHQLNQILNLYFSSPLLPPASLLVYLCCGEKEKYLIKHPATLGNPRDSQV